MVEMDTNFCFTIPQSRLIAEYIIKGQFADTLENQYNKEVKLLEVKAVNDSQIQEKLQLKILNLDSVIGNNEESILILTEQLSQQDKKLKKVKWHKIALGTAWLVTCVAFILK